ncbi:MAG TPA: ATP-binding cassette domain-containing protein [Ignavibacteriaceae bacterium]|nr:ATP-binding cassette domain-containing protein [Ignavibacteriaceae bacterium]
MLSIQNISFNYDNQILFDNANLELGAGEFAFLIGKSGSGKTSLLQMIYMNLLPQSGSIIVGNFNSQTIKKSELHLLRRKIGIVFQDFKLLTDRNVFENLSFVLEVIATPKKEIKKKVNAALNEVGLSLKRLNNPEKLSGGKKQRFEIARAILNDPLIILADEPTGNLDPETSGEILDLLQKINKRGTAVLFATHNYDMVRKGNTRIFKIEDKKILKGFLKPKDQ